MINILAVVNTKTKHIQLINTPRDYYIEHPKSNGVKDKLTHAGLYGVENSIGALENLYGVKINYYVRMNFSGFEDIIDAMGGIDVYSDKDFTVEPVKHYNVGKPLISIEALAFAREICFYNDI
ncbi:MAG: LCP family protein [Lachnospira eligens]